MKKLNNLDVIICTYNRPEKVVGLVENIFECDPLPSQVVVVDSSDEINESLVNNEKITYIRSDRKSQPYQRFLGVKKANSAYILFFDDDVKILKTNIFQKVVEGFDSNHEIVGISMGIHYENGVPINQIQEINNREKTGKISWLGNTTGLPKEDMFVGYFPGPIMSFRHEIMMNLFDEYLFSIFEKRIAMGEDKVISMRASQFGKLMYYGADHYLYHPPEPSTYFSNTIDFIAKTTFSRLWINKEYAKVNGKPILMAYLIFWLYFLKQIMTLNKEKLKGNFKALSYVFNYTQK